MLDLSGLWKDKKTTAMALVGAVGLFGLKMGWIDQAQYTWIVGISVAVGQAFTKSSP